MFRTSVLLFALLLVYNTGVSKQDATIKNLSAKITKTVGAASLNIKYDVVFSTSPKTMKAAHDTSDWYTISITFKDSAEVPVARGFERLADSTGHVMGDIRVFPYGDETSYQWQSVNIPLAAFALNEGTHLLRPVFTVRDQHKELVSCIYSPTPLSVIMPPRIKLKLEVKSILVSDTDQHGDTWDAWLFKFSASRPEVFWTTTLGGKSLNYSDYAMNSFTYSDPTGKDNFLFSICKGDVFYISVYDFDQLSRNDLIGTQKFDMATYQNTGTQHPTTFGLVREMDYTITER